MNKTLCIAKFLTKSCFSKGFIKLKRRVYTKVGSLTAEYASSAEPVSRKDGRNLEYRRIGAGRFGAVKTTAAHGFGSAVKSPNAQKAKKSDCCSTWAQRGAYMTKTVLREAV